MEGGRGRRPPPRATAATSSQTMVAVPGRLLAQPPRCPGAVRSIRCRRARMRRRHCASWGPPAAGNCVESRSCAGPCIRSRCPRRAPGQVCPALASGRSCRQVHGPASSSFSPWVAMTRMPRCRVPVTANAIRLGVEEPDAAKSGGFSPSIRLPMVDRLCFDVTTTSRCWPRPDRMNGRRRSFRKPTRRPSRDTASVRFRAEPDLHQEGVAQARPELRQELRDEGLQDLHQQPPLTISPPGPV
jgi:hypothetical protein